MRHTRFVPLAALPRHPGARPSSPQQGTSTTLLERRDPYADHAATRRKLLFWLLVIRLVLRGAARLFGEAPARPQQSAAPTTPRQIEDLVRDPVCQTYVPRSRAVSASRTGACF